MIISCLFLYKNMHTLILGHGTLAIFGVKKMEITFIIILVMCLKRSGINRFMYILYGDTRKKYQNRPILKKINADKKVSEILE